MKKNELAESTRRFYLKIMAEALCKCYGTTLVEYDLDLELAQSVYKKLIPFLDKSHSMDLEKFNKWREKFLEEMTGE